MPQAKTKAKSDARHGKAASTQASHFVKEEMESLHHGNKRIKNEKQAIAIGLSRARKAGVKVPARKH